MGNRGFACLTLFVGVLAFPYDTRAQFGVDCKEATFEKAVADGNYSAKIQAAMRATCAFYKKLAEHDAVFAKGGWSWSLLPRARQDLIELTDLANGAAELNFATNDPRALGNIKLMVHRIGYLSRWIDESEQKFANSQKQQRSTRRSGHSYSQGEDGGYRRRQIGVGVNGQPCHLPTTPGC